jgi:hypothetical protein
VAFVGSDLAFTGNQPYARGVAYEEDWRRLADWGVPLEQHWRDVMALWPHLEEPDIHGAPARTAAHLVTFRNWLAEQIAREKSRTIVNATGGGILHGPGVRQCPLADVVAAIQPRNVSLRSPIARRHSPASGKALECAARAVLGELTSGAMSPATKELLRTWEGFADGVSRDRIAAALARGLGDAAAPAHTWQRAQSGQKAEPSFDAESISPIAANLDLVWLPMSPVRMESVAQGTRMFRCRTTAARLVACAVRMPNPAVSEDGKPLRLGASLAALQRGEYFIWRDEVYFTSTDDSDPRENGRAYAVLMPQFAAYLEQLPLHEILEHGL